MSLPASAPRPARLLATGFGIGLLRPAPGTWGSLVTVFAVYALAQWFGPWAVVVLLAVALVGGYWASVQILAAGEDQDPSEVVIDEVAGQTLALLPAVFGSAGYTGPLWHLWPAWVGGFLLFRLFDIWKPSIIGWADRRGGAFGLMMDDLLAGLVAAFVTMLAAGVYHGALGL